jgi:3'-phosphoadenosine 5'-phosphosulfate sulfotransferase (PAPS reductase)/FAD synthetase
MISKKWQYLCNGPFKISDKCCEWLKKKPMDMYNKKSGRVPFLGIRTGEAMQREKAYLMYGCNAYDIKRPRSAPLSFWTHDDILKYIRAKNIKYSKLYDMGYDRSGCMFCMFGVHIEYQKTGTNRFIRMKKTHPRQWDYCINRLGLGEVLHCIGIPYEEKQLPIQWNFE